MGIYSLLEMKVQFSILVFNGLASAGVTSASDLGFSCGRKGLLCKHANCDDRLTVDCKDGKFFECAVGCSDGSTPSTSAVRCVTKGRGSYWKSLTSKDNIRKNDELKCTGKAREITTTRTTTTTTTTPPLMFCGITDFAAKYKLEFSNEDFNDNFDIVPVEGKNADMYAKLVCSGNDRSYRRIKCKNMKKLRGINHNKINGMKCL